MWVGRGILAFCELAFLILDVCCWEEQFNDKLEDDDSHAVKRVRQTLKDKPWRSKNGVVLVSGPSEQQWSQLSIPIWRAYCEHHGFDFFVQSEKLNVDYHFDWSIPRVLMEILPRVRWKYVLLVLPSSLPAKFNQSWEYVIKTHMRFKRYRNDDLNARRIFCPWDCEPGNTDTYSDGACYGPVLSGCIFWAKKPKTTKLVKSWYYKRHQDYFAVEQAVKQALHKTKERNYDEVFYKDISREIGWPNSTLFASFSYDAKKHGWNLRDQIYEYIKNKEELAEVANRQHIKEEMAEAIAAAEAARRQRKGSEL